MLGFGDIATGGGAITPDLSSSAESESGDVNSGGFYFEGYKEAANYTPVLIALVVISALWFMTKGKN
jgi:hypothetical protein